MRLEEEEGNCRWMAKGSLLVGINNFWIMWRIKDFGYHLRSVTIYFLGWKLFKLDILARRWALECVWIYPPSFLDERASWMLDDRIFVEEWLCSNGIYKSQYEYELICCLSTTSPWPLINVTPSQLYTAPNRLLPPCSPSSSPSPRHSGDLYGRTEIQSTP